MSRVRVRRRFRFVAMLVLTSACATTANYGRILGSWLGRPTEQLVRAWEVPISTFRMPGGNEIPIYDRSDTGAFTTPVQVSQSLGAVAGNVYVPGPAIVTGGQMILTTYRCRTEYEVDGSGAVVRWRWEGNACTARPPE